MAKPIKASIKTTVSSEAVKKALGEIPLHVAQRGLEKAAREAMKPVVRDVKMEIAKAMAGGVSKKGIRDYKRAVGVKVKVYRRGKKGGSVWAAVGARTKQTSKSSHREGDTRWSKLAHLFEWGTSRGIPAYKPITNVSESEALNIQKRMKDGLGDAIAAAVRRHQKLKQKKIAK